MKYTRYFGWITKEQGQLNLSTEQFQRLMNIVHLEGVIYGLNSAKDTYKNTDHYFRYDTVIHRYDTKLSDLTGDATPEVLLKEMVQGEE